MKKHYEKLAVFDLDGTLWKVNSHVDIINKYFKLIKFDGFIARIYRNIFPNHYMKILNYMYSKIPRYYVSNYKPKFRTSALNIMHEIEKEGYKVIIISNAPVEIVCSASERLKVEARKASINEKNIELLQNYTYSFLFVCTDNISDTNILDLADRYKIYVTKKTKKYFTSKFSKIDLIEVN